MSTAPLPLTPLSAVACDAVLCRQAGALFATVVVKATFQLVHGETARPVAPLGLVPRDQMGAGGSLAAARETAPHVPNAGVVLSGHAYAPGAGVVPVKSMSVRLGVSRDRPLVDKTLHVFGDRAANPSAIIPFQKMPLAYERAFGGPGVWDNPVGMGGAGSRALPNIVDPKDARRPAGFGPVAGAWMPRRRLLGGADSAALEQAIFEPSQGFDWRYFQAAPVDQQLDTLRGDEWIVLDGMHPTLPRVQTRLPRVRAQARRVATGGAVKEAIELRGDMLVIDADALVASVVWRGRFAAGSLEALRSVRVLVGLEVAGRPIDWSAGARVQVQPTPVQAETREVHVGAILGASLPFDGRRESVLPPPSAKAAPASISSGTVEVDVSKILQAAVPFGETALPPIPASVKGGGPPVPTETVMAIPALSLLQPQAMPFVPADPSKPPVEAAASRGAPRPAPIRTGTTDIDPAELIKLVMPYREEPDASLPASTPGAAPTAMAAPLAPVQPTSLAALPVAVASFTPVEAVAPVAPPALATPPAPIPLALLPAPVAPIPPVVPPSLALAVVASPPLAAPGTLPAAPEALGTLPVTDNEVRAAVLERLATGQSLEGLRLVQADLHEIDFKGASLVGLDLQKAKLAGAKLQEARLSQAGLVGADLTGADLSGADLGRADLSRAVLDGAKLDRAVLIGARLCDVRGKAASFTEARLAQADLQGAVLHETAMLDIDAPGSVWDNASLDGSRLLGAKLRGASFQRATMHGVCFSQADLTSASFHRAAGKAVDFRSARLEAADLRQAELPEAKLDDAELRDASANRADLSGARFFRAELRGANLRAAKLNGADLLHAKVEGADFRDTEIQGVKIDPAVARAAKIRLPR